MWLGWLASRVVSCWTQAQKARVQIAVAALSGNSLRQTAHTHHASVRWPAKLVAALLSVAGVTAGLAECNGSLSPGLWLASPAGWLPRTGISSGTLGSVIQYRLYFLPFYTLCINANVYYYMWTFVFNTSVPHAVVFQCHIGSPSHRGMRVPTALACDRRSAGNYLRAKCREWHVWSCRRCFTAEYVASGWPRWQRVIGSPFHRDL